MAFTPEIWQQQTTEKLHQLSSSFKEWVKTDIPYFLYSYLCVLSLWPLVEAIRVGGLSPIELGLALGGVTGGVGGNLVANLIQNWTGQPDLDETKIARQLAKQLATNPDLRQALDIILEKMAAISQAQAGLDIADRQWFAQTLRSELAQLGNLNRFETIITQGDRGQVLVGTQVEGDVLGAGASITYILNQYLTKEEQRSDPAELRQQVTGYLIWLADRCGTIELRGIKREGQQVVQLDLETVYVPLAAEIYEPPTGMRPRSAMDEMRMSRSISLDEVLSLGKRIILTGGPGSGKTTVLLHIAWTLARAIITDDPALARSKLGLTAGLPLPIFVPLSAYATYVRRLPPATAAHKRTLAAFISHYLIEKQSSFDLPHDFFQRLLRDGQAVVLLLDGLDEVPDEAERVRVRQAIEELMTGRDNMQAVVTCRTAAYKGRTALGKGFREVRVTPLDDAHIEALVRQAYSHIYRFDPATCRRKADELWQGIREMEAARRRRLGEKVERLVSSPLLVRMLLVVHFSERRLPEQRAELYMKATDAMLLPEYAPDEEIADRLGRLVGGSREVHRDLVQHLAFVMHTG